MVALRTGAEMRPNLTVEEAEEVELPAAHLPLVHAMSPRWVIGSPETARAQLAELAETFGVDEVMVHPVAGELSGADPERAANRERTLELLAG